MYFFYYYLFCSSRFADIVPMSSISTQNASSLLSFSSSTPQWKYDVFLSFRGDDTCNSFTDHLYVALKQKGIIIFRDEEEIKRAKSISPEFLKAIEESRFVIVILSRNYASSTWCLDELVKIIECMKEMKTIVFPIFYDVDPTNVRKQTGTFAEAFSKHEECFKDFIEKVQTWRVALRELANLKGWHLLDRSKTQFIQHIVGELWHKLSYAHFEDFEDLVGIEYRVKELESCLAIGSDDVRFIGVWGMGGIGKTTLARVVFQMVLEKFEGCCFLPNIREVSEKDGLIRSQQLLLSKISNERISIQDVNEGVFMIKNRLRHKRILLVLDDVDQLDQCNKLVGEHNWFGSGSRVIITTRDKHLLELLGVDGIYDAKGLNDNESLHLLSLKAFKKLHPPNDFLQISKDVVHHTCGLPLAIEIIGSLLFNRSINQWKSTLNRLTTFPEHHIIKALRISFDGLHEVEKEIFLHIACFFNHMDQDKVIEILDCLALHPRIGLDVLFKKSLIKLYWNQLWVHGLLQEMGWSIVHDECHKDPGKRSKLWLYKDIDQVLTKNTGTKAVEGIVLNLPKLIEADWNPRSFLMMQHLKLLIINNVHLMHDPKHLSNDLRYLDWRGYSSKSLPSSFQSNELIELHMCCSYIERLWKGTKGHSLDDRHLHKKYAIIFPGSKIPKWFRHQSIGAEVNIKEPFSRLCNEWMGIAVCVVFCSHPHHQIPNGDSLSCWLVANGKKMSSAPNTGHIVVLSDHIWLLYLLPQYYQEKQIKLLWECDANGFIRVGIRIMTHCSVFEVKRCGFRMVYKKDIEDVNRSMAQCSNNSTIPY
ncbi:disease resistance protein RPV1-like [Quercus robur]|uniref:disease resistance protein RPV1-like n=1 Tax=Quercus robur TaxID=38942 RepID=UPI002162EB83|nr:disease resistance protein RPV1-like [Quercus robur]